MASAEIVLQKRGSLGQKQHCARVALWADELAAFLEISACERAMLKQAALHHHDQPLLEARASSLSVEYSESLDRNTVCSAEEILKSFRGQKHAVSERAADMAHILELANTFDEQLEFSPYEDSHRDTLMRAGHEEHKKDDWSVRYVLSRLQKMDRRDLRKIRTKLPPYPPLAMKLFDLLSKNDVDLPELEETASADEVIAGKLIEIANSASYGPLPPVRTLREAIARVGLEDAKRLLLASGIQHFYFLPGMDTLWKPALEAGQIAEQIARMSKKVDPAQAFLAGLLHDIGNLAVSLLSPEVRDSLSRYVAAGCQPGVAEFVVCGFHHGEAGAEILRFWKFNEELATAVQYHHRPERTTCALAGVLYLTEFWLASDQDLPSNTRLAAATRLAGVSLQALEQENPRPTGALLGL